MSSSVQEFNIPLTKVEVWSKTLDDDNKMKESWDSKEFLSEKFFTSDSPQKLIDSFQDFDSFVTPVGHIKSEVEWVGPLEDWAKGETDASIKKGVTGFSYGIAIRGRKADKIFRLARGRSSYATKNIQEAETFGTYRLVVNAVELKRRGEIVKLHIQCDNDAVVKMVNGVQLLLPNDGPLINKLIPLIQKLLHDNFGVFGWKMTSSPREGLFLVDYLCFLGIFLDFDYEEIGDAWMDFTIRYICMRDSRGIPYIKLSLTSDAKKELKKKEKDEMTNEELDRIRNKRRESRARAKERRVLQKIDSRVYKYLNDWVLNQTISLEPGPIILHQACGRFVISLSKFYDPNEVSVADFRKVATQVYELVGAWKQEDAHKKRLKLSAPQKEALKSIIGVENINNQKLIDVASLAKKLFNLKSELLENQSQMLGKARPL